jgi:hypothetical protein
MPERKRLVRRVGVPAGLVLLSLAAALVVAEAAVRATNPYGISYYRDTNRYLNEAIELPPDAARPDGRIFNNRPHARLAFADFVFQTDDLGLRSAAPGESVARDPERARILFLGDSVTLGWGVNDAETWIRTLEREARFADGRPLACLNAGHLQYNTIQELDWLRTFGGPLRPAAVVLTFVVNDLDDAWGLYQSYARALAEPPAFLQRWKGRVLAWFRGLHGLVHFRASRAGAKTASEMQVERVEDTPEYRERWPLAAAALDGMLSTCVELGVPLVVLDHSTPRIPGVRAWCERNAVPWVDLAFTEGEWERDIRNSLADSHANALGNRILADKALRGLRAAGILAEASD